MSKFQTIARALAPAIAIAAALTCGAGANAADPAAGFEEGFEAGLSGWTAINNSSPKGFQGWYSGNDFWDAQAGSNQSLVSADYLSASGLGTISSWLISPELAFNNNDVVTFWTRTVDVVTFPDRLELRFSADGGTDVGSGTTSVGTFTNKLLVVNPNLRTTGYPTDWTQFSATITGLSGPTIGAIAFRYFVTDGGPGSDASNSELIAVDTVSITGGVSAPPPIPEPATYLMMALGLGAIGLRRMRATRS
jgi:hypothetical protein